MRIPVFARGANPRFDRPILRKSESYATSQVEHAQADWIDPDDHSKGILCRGLVYFGAPKLVREPVSPALFSGAEIPGLRFVPPATEKNPTIPAIHVSSLLQAAKTWDWTRERKQLSA